MTNVLDRIEDLVFGKLIASEYSISSLDAPEDPAPERGSPNAVRGSSGRFEADAVTSENHWDNLLKKKPNPARNGH